MTTTKKTRREFTDEFKREAVVLLRRLVEPKHYTSVALG